MSRALATRLKKLEAKRHNRRFKRAIIFTLYPDENAGEIVGLHNHRDDCHRLFGEKCLTAFAARASAALGGARIMLARYATPEPLGVVLEPTPEGNAHDAYA